jgi:hypothetical protein
MKRDLSVLLTVSSPWCFASRFLYVHVSALPGGSAPPSADLRHGGPSAVKAERDEMKNTLLAKLAAGFFVIGVCGMFTSTMAVPTFTFSPYEDGSKTLLTLSGQTDDRSDPRTVPDPFGTTRTYNLVVDDCLEWYIQGVDPVEHVNENGVNIWYYPAFTFTGGLEGLTVTSTLAFDPIDSVPPEHYPPEEWLEERGYPRTGLLSPVTYIQLSTDGPGYGTTGPYGTVPLDEFVFQFTGFTGGRWAEPGGLSPFLFSETLSFSGSAILDMDFSHLIPGTYRGMYMGQLWNDPPYIRDKLFGPTFEIVVTPEPATMIVMAAGLPLLLKRKRKSR